MPDPSSRPEPGADRLPTEQLAPSGFPEALGLPDAWTGKQQWRILDTDFESGLRFLATWQAWKADDARPQILHYAALSNSSGLADLAPLAQGLTAQFQDLRPGVHRLVFEGGRVLLTLCIGDRTAMLKEQAFDADSVRLGAFSALSPTVQANVHVLKSIARCCRRGTRLVFQNSSIQLYESLKSCGFELAAKQSAAAGESKGFYSAVFNPHWEPKKSDRFELSRPAATSCIIIGAGLAGAACANSLAKRGWRVTVLEAQAEPARGASGLPVGMLAPHVSPDDGALSRLSRSGLRATWQKAGELLEAGQEWAQCGALQRRFDKSGALPADWNQTAEHGSRPALASELNAALTSQSADAREFEALWHTQGGWVKPAQLVAALLKQASQGGLVSCHYNAKVHRLEHVPGESGRTRWRALDAEGAILAEADMVVLAAAVQSAELLAHTREATETPEHQTLIACNELGHLQAIRGQVTWGPQPEENPSQPAGLPPFPVNGHGSFVPAFPATEGDASTPRLSWLMGATFERDSQSLQASAADHATNLDKMKLLLPETAKALEPAFEQKTVKAWVGVRCVSPDRLPLVGPVNTATLPGLWACTALGSRGLTFSVMCGELLAAWLHAEPLPLEKRLADALRASRFNKLTSSHQQGDAS